MQQKDVSRFEKYYMVEPETGCWLWHGGHAGKGYGVFWLAPKLQYAHRISYEHHVAQIPDGYQIDHLCRIHNCVNPQHLEPVTPQVNTQRGLQAQRTHCPRGHEYNEANTYMNPSGSRQCRVCDRERKR